MAAALPSFYGPSSNRRFILRRSDRRGKGDSVARRLETNYRVDGGICTERPRQLDGRLAWLSNGRCQYQEALAAAEHGSEYPDELGLGTWALVELIEAAVRCGRVERATLAYRHISEVALASESDWALGLRARCRGLLSEGDEAEGSYREAIARLGRTRVHTELARAHLLYGEWLRRAGRRADARRELRLALRTFNAMRVDVFAERAQRELLATGETVRKRSVETFDELTPQEASIARLASTGYTNPEIATKLYLSERTIQWHLRKVFAKLGILSRRQLREVLPEVNGFHAQCEHVDAFSAPDEGGTSESYGCDVPLN